MGLAVSESYHPMAARGDLIYPLRQWAVIVPILAAIAVFSTWLRRGPLAPRIYLIGLSVLAVTALLQNFLRIDSDYRQVYWLDEDKYEIPWQYGPYNGNPERGGKFFLVKVSVPGLVPKYETQGATIIIGKAVDFNHGKGGTAPEEMCMTSHSQVECQWQRGNFVFIASGDTELFPPEVSGFMVSVADLLDSFEVSAP